MQPARIGAEHPQHGPGIPVGNAGPVRRILYAESPARPRAVPVECRLQERQDVPETDHGLIETGGDQDGFPVRLNQRPARIDGSARDGGGKRRLAIATGNAQARVAILPERARQKPPFPWEQAERLPRMPPLAELQILDISA